MIDKIKKKSIKHMEHIFNIFKNKINKIYSIRVSSNFLNNIIINCYNSNIYLIKLSNIVIENNKIIIITLFDKNILKNVNKALLKSNLNLNPIIVDDFTIKLILPELTKERRYYFLKIIRIEVEKCKINIRNIRKNIKNELKILLKNKSCNQDLFFKTILEIQNITNIWIKKINNLLKLKELELIKN